jgi:hypothetical protein
MRRRGSSHVLVAAQAGHPNLGANEVFFIS